MGICMQDIDKVHAGCLKPSPKVGEENFVFYCHFCSKRKGTDFPVSTRSSNATGQLIVRQFEWASNRGILGQLQTLFRYDPAVVVVNMKLPHHDGQMAESIIPLLRKWYKGDEKSAGSLISLLK